MFFKYIPNIISLSRIIATPFFILFMLKNTFFYKMLSLLVFFIASVSDILDGYIARKYNYVTNFGKYMDPLADKFLILSAFTLMYFYFPNSIKLWMVLLIFSRDIFITSFRIKMKKNNIIMQTSSLAKIKTLFQIITIHIVFIFYTIDSNILSQVFFEKFIYYLMIVCVAITLFTGAHYVKINSKFINAK